MLRPIDIQSQFAQSPTFASQQQAVNGQMAQSQEQLAQLIQKELADNQEVILEINHDEKIENKNKENKNTYKQQNKKKQKDKDKNKDKDKQGQISGSGNRIDIRL